jgi:hypothetical protein
MDKNDQFREYVKCIKTAPKAVKIFSEWNLFLEPNDFYRSTQISLVDVSIASEKCVNVSALWKKFAFLSK